MYKTDIYHYSVISLRNEDYYVFFSLESLFRNEFRHPLRHRGLILQRKWPTGWIISDPRLGRNEPLVVE